MTHLGHSVCISLLEFRTGICFSDYFIILYQLQCHIVLNGICDNEHEMSQNKCKRKCHDP
jgi:hypothetical protein